MGQQDEPLPVATGEVIDGRYRIDRVLGRGGMGVVYAAEHLLLKAPVAIKFLVNADSAEAVARFAREAQVTARLSSPHAIRVTDVATPVGRPAYLVMELLAGGDLGAIASERPLAVEDAAGYVLQACDAIAEAHASGIVHRDLKPANLFLARQPDGSSLVKVLDFGLSKLVRTQEGDPSLSTTSTVMGSPCYMPPEQLRSAKRVDPRADIWSMGVVLYELVTGKLPFDFEGLSGLLVAIATDPYVPASTRAHEVPASLDDVFARCFQKKPRDRYPDIVAFARDVARFARPEDRARLSLIEQRAATAWPIDPTGADTIVQSPVALESTMQASPTTVSIVRRQKRRGAPAVFGAGIALALALGTGATWTITRERGGTATVPAANAAREAPTTLVPPPATREMVPPPSATSAPSASALPAAPNPSSSSVPVTSPASLVPKASRRGPRAKPVPAPTARPAQGPSAESPVLVDAP